MGTHGFLKTFSFWKIKTFIKSTDLLKTKTLKCGIYRKLKMKFAFCIHNIKASDFVYTFVYISDFKLTA